MLHAGTSNQGLRQFIIIVQDTDSNDSEMPALVGDIPALVGDIDNDMPALVDFSDSDEAPPGPAAAARGFANPGPGFANPGHQD